MGDLFGIDGDLLERQYKKYLSGYYHWEQLSHAEEWILFPKNMSSYIGIDEVALSRGELYTVLINKQAKGRRGSLSFKEQMHVLYVTCCLKCNAGGDFRQGK